MLDAIFLTVNEWMVAGSLLAAAGCFAWGMISVLFSPCHLASIPLIVAYVGGQQKALVPRQAAGYAVAFSIGLFITIAVIGVICALLGRMLGDIGSWWQVLIGGVLIWVALGMLGVESCSMSGSLLYRLNFKGLAGALALGLGYGILSGSCTFGFIAPILAIITVQQEVATGRPLHPALRHRPLPADRRCRQLHRRRPPPGRKQRLAGRRRLVSQGRRCGHLPAGAVLCYQPDLGELRRGVTRRHFHRRATVSGMKKATVRRHLQELPEVCGVHYLHV